MRNLVYRLANGSVVRTYAEAVASGQTYKVEMENVDRPKVELSPKRKALLKKATLRVKNA